MDDVFENMDNMFYIRGLGGVTGDTHGVSTGHRFPLIQGVCIDNGSRISPWCG
jgi:hypothetical protein